MTAQRFGPSHAVIVAALPCAVGQDHRLLDGTAAATAELGPDQSTVCDTDERAGAPVGRFASRRRPGCQQRESNRGTSVRPTSPQGVHPVGHHHRASRADAPSPGEQQANICRSVWQRNLHQD